MTVGRAFVKTKGLFTPCYKAGSAFIAGLFLLAVSVIALTPPALSEEPFDFDALGYVPDFSYAGYGSGLEEVPQAAGTILRVDDFGAVPDDEVDDSQAIQAALQKARTMEGPVVLRFSAGRYIITDILKINRSHFVLQGAGRGKGGTTLIFPRPLAMMENTSALDELRAYIRKYNKRQRQKPQNLDVLFSEYSWSGGFLWVARDNARPAPYLKAFDPPIIKAADIRSGERGRRQVSVADAAALQVGDVLQIHWFNKDGENGALIKEIYQSDAIKVGSHHWTFPDRPLVRQMVEIESISGNEVTFKQPLLHPVSDAIPAQLSRWEHLTHVGIEDLHFEFPNAPDFGHHVERGYNAIYLTSAYDSWVRNIRITNADSGILTYDTANTTISNIETRGERQAHYTVHIGNAHNVLVQDLTVFNRSRHSISLNTQATKCVYSGVHLYTDPVLDQHAGSNHQNLFENVTAYISPKRTPTGWAYPLYDGSGARYWQPGHGAFNTSWNIHVIVEGGPAPGDSVRIDAIDEGPHARIVGLRGNRPLTLDYRPAPATLRLNQAMQDIPSLREYQQRKRLQARLKPERRPAADAMNMNLDSAIQGDLIHAN